jgi:hypothetical protein
MAIQEDAVKRSGRTTSIKTASGESHLPAFKILKLLEFV